jgi:16S rRNA (cytosine967-C5)-methyltransferase
MPPADVRSFATDILAKVETRNAYADILLDHSLRTAGLTPRDGALLTELCYGTLRWRGRIDSLLTGLISQPLERAHPFTRNLLRVTLYQIEFLTRIPDYAAVNAAVEIAKVRRGQATGRFVNAVLRRYLREKPAIPAPGDPANGTLEEFSAYWSHPSWLVRHWREYVGTRELADLLQANNQEAPVVLRANSLKTTQRDLLALLRDAGVRAEPGNWSPQAVVLASKHPVDRLPGFCEGLFQVQGEASQLVGYLLGPRAGERILDVCAAPGGKTTHLAELAGDQCDITAADIAPRGLRKIAENARRLALKSISTVVEDASAVRIPLEQFYDRILVDAPCSGFGTLRSHPEIKWQRHEADIKRLRHLQQKILMQSVARLKPGGILVYSTCTLIADENERGVQQLLEKCDALVREDAADYLPEAAKVMVRDGYFLAWPHRHGTDGFFAARLRKQVDA